ncbi:hypothetical protein HK405_015915, partial [Cladochytrium tenue]
MGFASAPRAARPTSHPPARLAAATTVPPPTSTSPPLHYSPAHSPPNFASSPKTTTGVLAALFLDLDDDGGADGEPRPPLRRRGLEALPHEVLHQVAEHLAGSGDVGTLQQLRRASRLLRTAVDAAPAAVWRAVCQARWHGGPPLVSRAQAADAGFWRAADRNLARWAGGDVYFQFY